MTSLLKTKDGAAAELEAQPASAGARALLPLMAGMLATMMPVTMLVPVLKELVATRYGVSSSWAHLFMSANLVGALLFAPIGGYLADRLGSPKPVLIIALLVDAVLLFAMRWAPTFPMLLGIRLIEGGAHVLAVSMWLSAAAAMSGRARSGPAMGAMGASIMLGTALGVPLGGRIGDVNPLAVLTVGPLMAVGGAAAALVWLPTFREQHRPGGMREAMQIIRRQRWLLVPYAYTLIDRLCIGVVVSTLILYLADVMHLSPGARGGMMAMFLLPMAALCYPFGRLSDAWGRLLPMAVGSLVFGVVFAGYGFLGAGGMKVAMVASGVLSAMMFAPSLALCRDLAPDALRTTAFAGFNAAGSLGFLLGPMLGLTVMATLTDRVGIESAYRATFIVAGATEVLCAVISIPFLLRLARRAENASEAV